MHPAEVALGGAVQAPSDTAELTEEVVAALDRTAHAPQPALPSRRGSKPEACAMSTLAGGAVPVGTISLRGRPGSRVTHSTHSGRLLGLGRAHDQRLEQPLGLASVVLMGATNHRTQRHGTRVTGQVQRRA